MASVTFNARERRLVFEGTCWPEDAAGLADAVGAFAEPGRLLVVDLTRLLLVPPPVARAIGQACRRVELDGCRVQVWARPESTTATLVAAERAERAERAARPVATTQQAPVAAG